MFLIMPSTRFLFSRSQVGDVKLLQLVSSSQLFVQLFYLLGLQSNQGLLVQLFYLLSLSSDFGIAVIQSAWLVLLMSSWSAVKSRFVIQLFYHCCDPVSLVGFRYLVHAVPVFSEDLLFGILGCQCSSLVFPVMKCFF